MENPPKIRDELEKQDKLVDQKNLIKQEDPAWWVEGCHFTVRNKLKSASFGGTMERMAFGTQIIEAEVRIHEQGSNTFREFMVWLRENKNTITELRMKEYIGIDGIVTSSVNFLTMMLKNGKMIPYYQWTLNINFRELLTLGRQKVNPNQLEAPKKELPWETS